jgi:hypothetical protein
MDRAFFKFLFTLVFTSFDFSASYSVVRSVFTCRVPPVTNLSKHVECPRFGV